MSKYNECPYIELVLNEVSAENKTKLLNFINGKSADGTGTISFTLVSTVSALNSLDAGITPVAFKYNSTIVWNGYFIKTTNYKVFLTFKNGVDLTLGDLYRVDSLGLTFTEYVTSDNIRTLLREDSYIDASEIPTELPSTTEASAGQILGLDNEKKPQWQNTPSGGTKLYKHTYSTNGANSFIFISTNGNKLTDASQLADNILIPLSYYSPAMGPGQVAISSKLFSKFTNVGTGIWLYYLKLNSDQVYTEDYVTLTSFSSDTVTEL